ncbi:MULTISPECIES: DUF417 family protein [unclassified Corynebacterium]|uniref:DUF417 family protein n=1 Tax=unclassified Corynebacterium TaxID=2624378 RepID=UPI0029CA65C8|nr:MULTISPECIES: DUF417 family protein [unclassified Corynebacterium]WPF66432.1 DUF417 family protein [Corynebacterium sp. 22KM0430]WPF68922.1 DUF417 family protein [Corynebacterium sp. 21KM1197]
MHTILTKIAGLERVGATLTRLGLIIVTVWIGALKIFDYEAQGIIPFVANSPFMSWLMRDPENYAANKIPEGAADAAAHAWHEANGTYTIALLIGGTIVTIGVLIALGWIWPKVGVIGSLLLVGMSVVTLSFLVTTPEVWVSDKGGGEGGFPLLAAPGRLVIKDAIMIGASLWSAADFARIAVRRNPQAGVTEG